MCTEKDKEVMRELLSSDKDEFIGYKLYTVTDKRIYTYFKYVKTPLDLSTDIIKSNRRFWHRFTEGNYVNRAIHVYTPEHFEYWYSYSLDTIGTASLHRDNRIIVRVIGHKDDLIAADYYSMAFSKVRIHPDDYKKLLKLCADGELEL